MPAPTPQPSALNGFRTDEVILFDGEIEPRVLDTALGQRLGFKRERDVRKVIERHRDSLEQLGTFRDVRRENPGQPGRPVIETWLNEKQAIFVITKSQTRMAAALTVKLVEAFIAYRAAQRHTAAALPSPATPADARTRNRVRYAKLRMVEAVSVLDELGVDVMAIDMATVLRFSRAVMR